MSSKDSDRNLIETWLSVIFPGVYIWKEARLSALLTSYMTMYGHGLQPISKYEETQWVSQPMATLYGYVEQALDSADCS